MPVGSPFVSLDLTAPAVHVRRAAELDVLHGVVQLQQVRAALGLGTHADDVVAAHDLVDRGHDDGRAARADLGELAQLLVGHRAHLHRVAQVLGQLLQRQVRHGGQHGRRLDGDVGAVLLEAQEVGGGELLHVGVRLAVQVGVVTGGQSSVAENGVLVGPGGVGEQNVARDIAVLQELREKTKRARARDCLGVGNHVLLLVVDLVTPCELASGVVEIGNTDQGRVLVVLRAAESLLGLTDARKHVGLPLHPHTNPNLSMLIAVGTHSQNDLSGIFISIILLLKEKDGIRLGTRYLSIRF